MALPDKDTMAAIAVTRFGLGARPGELEAASSNPKAWLKNQLTLGQADQPVGDLPDSATRFVSYRQAQQERQALLRANPAATAQASAQAAAAGDKTSKTDVAARVLSQTTGVPMAAAKAQVAVADATGLQDEFLARAELGANVAAPFRERWVLFWANHFTVSATKGQARPLVGPFEREVIRPNAFGKFENMALMSSSHPGMLFYLDQAQSVGPDSMRAQQAERARKRNPNAGKQGLNENLAREIMELHTVGVDAGYKQADVTEFARAMTGWSVGGQADIDRDGKFIYRPATHEPGDRTIMGRHYGDTGGTQAMNIIKDLAAHPATARHIARKLAIHFVSDEPNPVLVSKLERAFIDSKGDLGQVASALIDADEAWAPTASKFKNPYEFVVSAHRALGVAPSRPQQVINPLNQLGQPPFQAPSPKGWAEDIGSWAAPDALIKRLTWAQNFAAQVSGGPREPMKVAQDALGQRLTTPTATAIASAESRNEALTVLFMSPEFQRR